MLYAAAAGLVVFLHFLFVIFAVFGSLLLFRFPRICFLHIPALIWAAWIELSGRICPLTPLENYFRGRAGDTVYTGSFLEHYLVQLLYPAFLTRELQISLGLGLLIWNLTVYCFFFRKKRETLSQVRH